MTGVNKATSGKSHHSVDLRGARPGWGRAPGNVGREGKSLEQPVWPWEDVHVCTSLTHASKGEVEALPFQACNVCEATCGPGGTSDRGPAVRL